MNGARHWSDRVRLILAYAAPTLPAIIVAIAIIILFLTGGLESSLSDLLMEEIGPLVRSAVAGTLTTLLVVLLALGLATLTIQIWLRADRLLIFISCGLLSLSATPIFLGNSSFAFIWNTPYAEYLSEVFATRGSATVVVIDITAQILRYAPLATWLLAIVVFNGEPMLRLYSRHAGLGPTALMRAEFLYRWMPACLVVAAFAYQDASNDYMVTYLALRPSVATHTELISHFLSRSFLSAAIGHSARDAAGVLTATSLVGGLVLSLVFLALVLLVLSALRLLRPTMRRSKGKPSAQRLSPARPEIRSGQSALSSLLPAFAGAIVIAGLCYRLAGLERTNIKDASVLLTTLLLSLAVAILCWGVGAVISFVIRELHHESDGSAQRSFAAVALVAVSLGFIPPLGLAAAVYMLLFSIGDFGQGSASVGWFIAQTVRMLPLVFVFLIPTALTLEDEAIWYLRINEIRFWKRLYILLLMPSKATHFAIILIGWNFVFNEGVISSVFQANIPAFSDIIQRATSGRSAAYPLAGLLITAESILFGALCLIWGFQIYSRWASQNAKG
jgi:hypothetical protein